VFGLLPLTLSLVAFLVGWQKGDARWLAAAGALGALAALTALTKTGMGFNLAALALFLAWPGRHEGETWPETLRGLAALGGGAAGMAAIAVAPWLVSGGLSEFWYANVTFNAAYSSQLSWTERLVELIVRSGKPLAASLPLWVLAESGLAVAALPSGERWLLRLWFLASMVAVAWTGYFYAHYLIQVLPAASLLAAAALKEWSGRWHWRRTRLVYLPLMCLLAYISLMSVADIYFAGDAEARYRARALDADAWARNGEAPAVAERIRELTGPAEEIYVLGWESQLYLLSDRRPAARVAQIVPLIVDPGLADETLAELKMRPPALFIDTSQPNVGMRDPLPDEIRARFASYIYVSYDLIEERRVGNHVVEFYALKR
jgi:hypothetical protein